MITIRIKTHADRDTSHYCPFAIGDTVYDRSDIDQMPYIIEGVVVYETHTMYVIRSGDSVRSVGESYLSESENVILRNKYGAGN